MDEREIQQLRWDNNKYIRALREICIADPRSYIDYKHMVEEIKKLAFETVGDFEVRKYE